MTFWYALRPFIRNQGVNFSSSYEYGFIVKPEAYITVIIILAFCPSCAPRRRFVARGSLIVTDLTRFENKTLV